MSDRGETPSRPASTSSNEAAPPMVSAEHRRVGMLAQLFRSPGDDPRNEVILGIGDDAALLRGGDETLVWSIDAQVDGVHFRRSWMSLADIGYRATMAALSDLAAMGARPVGVLAALTLPSDLRDDELLAIAAGQREAASALGTTILGGNMTRGQELSITTSVLGRVDRPIRRAGARPGDRLWLAGHLGRAACGLSLFERGIRPAHDEAKTLAVKAFQRPVALIESGLAAARAHASSMIDVSDGLAADLGHMARSSDVALVLHADALFDSVVDALAAELGLDTFQLTVSGGEDYALVATLPPDGASRSGPEGFRLIGEVESGLEPGVWVERRDGSIERLGERGFDHFASPT